MPANKKVFFLFQSHTVLKLFSRIQGREQESNIDDRFYRQIKLTKAQDEGITKKSDDSKY